MSRTPAMISAGMFCFLGPKLLNLFVSQRAFSNSNHIGVFVQKRELGWIMDTYSIVVVYNPFFHHLFLVVEKQTHQLVQNNSAVMTRLFV